MFALVIALNSYGNNRKWVLLLLLLTRVHSDLLYGFLSSVNIGWVCGAIWLRSGDKGC